jgi:hypothetical protein
MVGPVLAPHFAENDVVLPRAQDTGGPPMPDTVGRAFDLDIPARCSSPTPSGWRSSLCWALVRRWRPGARRSSPSSWARSPARWAVLCGETSLILRREIYATAAVAGATTYVMLDAWISQGAITLTVSIAVTLILRLSAVRFDFHLPTERPKELTAEGLRGLLCRRAFCFTTIGPDRIKPNSGTRTRQAEKGYCRRALASASGGHHADGDDGLLTPNARCAPVSPCTSRNRARS